MSEPASPASSRCCDLAGPRPPKHSRVIGLLATFVVACAGCCALPLVSFGLITVGASAVAAATGLLVVAAVLFGIAGLTWALHYSRVVRQRATGRACPYC